ncbi:hypothetical protein CDL12_29491 [Handroanthus impetiginosus]|uniref:DUF4219 domain-containing protein n=1 Tax=Handroanthus impetiginosus TaxID=429701 RepID=A0A2G9FY88_9LAMI|nr:hypothetical protein CDL12_29491 [Handroanthus impetiginosus]
MANVAKFEFVPFDISEKNYLSWVVDAKMHLDAMGLKNTIVEKNEATIQNRAKTMIFLRHHLDESLKIEYLTARYDWLHLRLQDFKSISEYNSVMFKITSQLMLCGEKISDKDMLEKTLSTFHASNLHLQQQYREKGFKKYSELISCLLVAEQNNELLMKNYESRPTGSSPFPEANATNFSNSNRSHGRGRGRYNYRNYGNGHWSRICRTPKHLVELYQASLKKKNKNIEANLTNFINNFDNDNDNDTNDIDIAHLDVTDFFEHREDKIDHLIGNGNVQKN